jgi:DNA transposition AAA+ family ATPase
MRLTEEQKAEIESSVPASAAVRDALKKYMEATGMNPPEMADAVGCTANVVRYFLRDEYHVIAESDRPAAKRFWEFMQSHPIIAQTKSDGKLYDTQDYRLLRKYFYLALNRRRAYVVQADPGIGKTFGAKHLISELNRREISGEGNGRRAYFVRSSGTMTPTQLLKEIAQACGVSPIGDSRRVVRALRRAFSARAVVIVIDEAQQLSIAALEAVRELLDEPPHCGLLVLGSHELERKFTANAVELEQWNSRISGFRALGGLGEDEARLIISEELPQLPEKAVRAFITDCMVPHLRKRGAKYISPRRLFNAIEDIKAEDGEEG